VIRTLAALFVAALMAGGAPLDGQGRKPSQMDGDELFAAWRAQGEAVLKDAFPSLVRFEEFRADFRGRVLTNWEAGERTRAHALFMLDVALNALARGYRYWLDIIQLGRVYLRDRAQPPGADESFDQFEIVWNKTAIAILSGQRLPDKLMEQLQPLARRMRPSADQSPDAPVLIDPWILLARGFGDELFTIVEPSLLELNGPFAIAFYDQALPYASVRAEAALRAAWLLTRLGRQAEALERLSAFDDRWTSDPVLRYWHRLFRGKALEGLGRPNEAAAAYDQALSIVPSAQSPRIAMMAIDARLNRPGEAAARALDIRTTTTPVIDPWWSYPFGDLRFFAARMKALRAMVTP
jgi:tetratricopeptide (TPR) repeat protein